VLGICDFETGNLPAALSLRSMVSLPVVLLSQTRGDLFSMVHHLLDVLVLFLKTLL